MPGGVQVGGGLRGSSLRLGALLALLAVCATSAAAQNMRADLAEEEEFGPVVRAYLGYLRSEQNVTDDSASRHEVSPEYYRRNSNRIRALRQTAIRLARESGLDYVPELEAVARDEMGHLFDDPPRPEHLRAGEVLLNTFRYIGPVRGGNETFYLFIRLDPYEQTELMRSSREATANSSSESGAPNVPRQATEARDATSAPGSAPAADNAPAPPREERANRPRRAGDP